MPLAEAEFKFTYADYLTWSDDERWELIEGIPHAMAPAPTRRHQEAVVEICRRQGDSLPSGETFGAPEIRALEDVAVSEAVTDLHLDLDRLASILEVM
ncbi:PDDEXK family nuclease [Methylohalobius crimeensis]|uniref:hypothetical protein n=1 Tax=Methylohalobius crimeensis TaxID=244365 RepID=UPI0003B51E57|nr:hypothetical protein [Methylohalobius crimeensis]